MKMIRELRAAIWNTLFGHAYTYDRRRGVEKMLPQSEVYKAIARFSVPSLPSDDPRMDYWQGYADAQYHITKAVEKL